MPLHPYHAFLLRGVIFLFPPRKHVKETTLITRRDGHFPPRLFCIKNIDTAPKLCALIARMVVGANSVRPFVHQTNLYYLHNICMLCKPFSASFLHDKKTPPELLGRCYIFISYYRFVYSIRLLSTSRATSLPSLIAHTTSDCPLRTSPAAKTFFTLV